MSQAFIQRQVEQRPLAGLNGWQLDKSCFDATLSATAFEPLMYHYIRSWRQMEFLHRLFLMNSQTEHPDDQATDCAAYQGNVQCAATTDPLDRPWVSTGAGLCSVFLEGWRTTRAPGIAGAVWLSGNVQNHTRRVLFVS